MVIRNKQYHEIDSIELHGSRIAARITSRLRAVILQGFKDKSPVNISLDFVSGIFLPLITASILADLRGRRRSFRYADESFNLDNIEELELAHEKKKGLAKRIVGRPVKNYLKKKAFKVTIENAPEELVDIYGKVKSVYKGGKQLKSKIEKTPIQQVGKKSRVKKVPEPFISKAKKKFKHKLVEENERVKQEIKDKIKQEKKYIYDELVRHLRTLSKDVIVEGVKTVNWQEVLDRLNNDERNVKDIKSLINQERLETSIEKLLRKLINKAQRKIRDKKERAKRELKEKAVKEAKRVGREYIVKPIKKPIVQKISEKIFGQPRKAGSHRQYRSSYYYTAKALQELEKDQRHRRQFETAQHIFSSIGGIADLIGFLAEFKAQDIFVFLSEMGGASFFPETYKIGGVVKAANYVGEVANTFEFISEDQEFNKVREYQVKRTLRLIQELKTIKKLISRYHPPVFNILKNASTKVNDNLRQVVNDLILKGATVQEGSKVLAEAFAANGLSIKEPFKIETIFRTQSALAYAAGRWQSDQHPAIQEILWGYKYVTVGDSRVRPQHKVLDGVTLPKDDEFWLYFWPPNGWNCRCSVISLFEPRQIVYPPSYWKGLAEIDKDFVFNAGMVFTESAAHLAGSRV